MTRVFGHVGHGSSSPLAPTVQPSSALSVRYSATCGSYVGSWNTFATKFVMMGTSFPGATVWVSRNAWSFPHSSTHPCVTMSPAEDGSTNRSYQPQYSVSSPTVILSGAVFPDGVVTE